MTTPPDYGGHEIEEGLLEDLGGPHENHPVSRQDEPETDFSDNELHAAGQTCPRCGTAIHPGQYVRLRANGHGVDLHLDAAGEEGENLILPRWSVERYGDSEAFERVFGRRLLIG